MTDLHTEARADIFLGRAKVETFRRDVNRMNAAMRMDWGKSADTMGEAQGAWDALRRWLDCVNPNPTRYKPIHLEAAQLMGLAEGQGRKDVRGYAQAALESRGRDPDLAADAVNAVWDEMQQKDRAVRGWGMSTPDIHDIAAALWPTICKASDFGKPPHGAAHPSYTRYGNSDAETEARTCALTMQTLIAEAVAREREAQAAEIARLRAFVAEVALQTGYTASDGFKSAQPTPLAIRARAALNSEAKP